MTSAPLSPEQIFQHATENGGQDADSVQAALEFVRTHLNMEVAYLSEFVDDDLVFRAVSAPGFEEVVHVGGSMPLDAVYCRHILTGRLPELIPDTARIPLCQDIPLTHDVPIKSHVSVPIRRSDGSNYGMFCCLSRETNPDLNDRDLQVMRAFAQLSSNHVNMEMSARLKRERIEAQLRPVMSDSTFNIVYQPIMDAQERTPKGFEALCRFPGQPYRPPNLWFDDALEVGLQADLEIAVIKKALQALDGLPVETYVSVNASPATVQTGRLADVFAPWPHERIVLEVTEHSKVQDYDGLLKILDDLRFSGVRLAIDDAGAGYSGLQHIVRLRPDIIKLDISLTSNIDTNVVKRSLASALVNFSKEIDACIVAEGVEAEDELQVLYGLGIPLVQGYLLSRPVDLRAARMLMGLERDIA